MQQKIQDLYTATGKRFEDVVKDAHKLVLHPKAYKELKIGRLELTDINPTYVLARVEEDFGIQGIGWRMDYDMRHERVVRGDKFLTYAWTENFRFIISLFDENGNLVHELEYKGEGAHHSDNSAWAMKGAVTSSLMTALYFFGYNWLVHMNLLTHKNAPAMYARYNNDGEPELGDEEPDEGVKENPRKPVLVPEGLPFAGENIYDLDPEDEKQGNTLKYMAGLMKGKDGNFYDAPTVVKTAALSVLTGTV